MENLMNLMQEVETRHIKFLKGELGTSIAGKDKDDLIFKVIKKVFGGKDEETKIFSRKSLLACQEKFLTLLKANG